MHNHSPLAIVQALDLTRRNVLPLQPNPPPAGRSPSDNVAQRPQRPVGHDGRIRRRKGGQEAIARLAAGLRIPVVGLLCPADDGAAVEVPGDAKGPRSVCVLAGDCGVAGVCDETSLAW